MYPPKVFLPSGQRQWNDPWTIKAVIDTYQPDIIIDGGAKGVDSFVHQYCLAHPDRYPVHIFDWRDPDTWTMPLQGNLRFCVYDEDWNEIGPSAGPRRNEAMIAITLAYYWRGSDCLFSAFMDEARYGDSRGTKGCFEKAIELAGGLFPIHQIPQDLETIIGPDRYARWLEWSTTQWNPAWQPAPKSHPGSREAHKQLYAK